MDTNKSLLQRAKETPQSDAWFKLISIYDPLIAGWVIRAGIGESDVSDITQEVLQALSSELGKFDHNGRVGAFRNWLKMITINRCRRYWDAQKRQLPRENTANPKFGMGALSALEDPNSDLSLLWNSEHDRYIINQVLQIIRSEFSNQSFEVFNRNVINGESPQSIAKDCGISVGQIYKIKFRVMKRLRLEADGLIDHAEFGFGDATGESNEE